MREILFRGKWVVNGEWVTGFYTCFNEKEHRIYSGKKARKQLKTAKAEAVKEFAERLIGKAKSTKERFLLESLVESVMKEMEVEEKCKEND